MSNNELDELYQQGLNDEALFLSTFFSNLINEHLKLWEIATGQKGKDFKSADHSAFDFEKKLVALYAKVYSFSTGTRALIAEDKTGNTTIRYTEKDIQTLKNLEGELFELVAATKRPGFFASRYQKEVYDKVVELVDKQKATLLERAINTGKISPRK